ncbi:MAG: hypothetical protein B7Z31_16020 [Rhodobacterales bacterium 12-65-15]|nr:MAG: hypothetical protein B7Z31_16020 [Rhodobacterales bacterium 12-65-15]
MNWKVLFGSLIAGLIAIVGLFLAVAVMQGSSARMPSERDMIVALRSEYGGIVATEIVPGTFSCKESSYVDVVDCIYRVDTTFGEASEEVSLKWVGGSWTYIR